MAAASEHAGDAGHTRRSLLRAQPVLLQGEKDTISFSREVKLPTNFENPSPVARFKDPKAAILHWKCLQEATCDSVKSYQKPPVTS